MTADLLFLTLPSSSARRACHPSTKDGTAVHFDGVQGVPGPMSVAYAAPLPAEMPPRPGPGAAVESEPRRWPRQSQASRRLLADRPSDAERCAGEGSQCWCAGHVYYGIGDRWHSQPATGLVWCTNVSVTFRALLCKAFLRFTPRTPQPQPPAMRHHLHYITHPYHYHCSCSLISDTTMQG